MAEVIKSVSGHYVAALRLLRERFLENWDTPITPGGEKGEARYYRYGSGKF